MRKFKFCVSALVKLYTQVSRNDYTKITTEASVTCAFDLLVLFKQKKSKLLLKGIFHIVGVLSLHVFVSWFW